MGAAVPIIGLGLSAVSTVAGLSEQSKQARAQQQALQAQIDASRDRLTLARQQFESTKQYAAFIREREKGLIDAQAQQALHEQYMNELAQQFELANMKMQSNLVEQQAAQAASNILVSANNEAQQAFNANREDNQNLQKQLDEAVELQSQMQTATPSSGTQLANQQNLLAAATDAQQKAKENMDARERGARLSLAQAEGSANYQRSLGKLGKEFIDSTANLQQAYNQQLSPIQRQMIELQRQRNQIASEAAATSMASSANMAYLSNAIAERANIASLQAQKQAVRPPGFLSYVNAASGLLSQAAPLFARPQNIQTQSGYNFGGQPLKQYDLNYAQQVPDLSSARFGGFTK